MLRGGKNQIFIKPCFNRRSEILLGFQAVPKVSTLKMLIVDNFKLKKS